MDPERVVSFLVSSLQPGTWRSYEAKLRIFFEYCRDAGVAPVPAAPEVIHDFACFLMARGTIQASTAQPYFLAVNTLHDLFGFLGPTRDDPLLRRLRRGWQNSQRLAPGVIKWVRTPLPALVVERLCGLCGAPSDASNLAALFVIFLFVTMLHSDSAIRLRLADIRWDPPFLQYRPPRVKGAILPLHGRDFLQIDLSDVGVLARFFDQLDWTEPRRRLWASADFHGPPEPPATLFSRALALVEFAPPTGERWSPHSTRAGAVSAAAAIGVPLERIEVLGGWAPNSVTLRRVYIDFGIPADASAHRFFAWLRAPVYPLRSRGQQPDASVARASPAGP